MRTLPERLLTQDLLLRPPREDERLPAAAADLRHRRIIETRSSGRVAGFIGQTEAGPWLELAPEHRGRGRGTEALAAWLRASLEQDAAVRVRGDDETSRAFLRKFAFSPEHGELWVSTRGTRQRLDDLAEACRRRYRQRVHMSLLELGIPDTFGAATGLPIVYEASALDPIGTDIHGRIQYLAPRAATAWAALRDAAAAAKVELQLVSAFRGFDYQLALVRRKMNAGEAIDRILQVSAAPGFSQHHSGRALDLTCPGYPALESAFEDSPAFAWLRAEAKAFGFVLSYPPDNPHGILYEPWHWCWTGDGDRGDPERVGDR